MSSISRIELSNKPTVSNSEANSLRKKIEKNLNIKTGKLTIVYAYSTKEKISNTNLIELATKAFQDLILQTFSTTQELTKNSNSKSYITVGFKPGVTDNLGMTASEIAGLFLNKKKPITFFSSKVYLFEKKLSSSNLKKIAETFLINNLIQEYKKGNSKPEHLPLPEVYLKSSSKVKNISLDYDKRGLEKLSNELLLAMQPVELEILRDHLKDAKVLEKRKKLGLSEKPTDAELECFAQTQSEHCKHKVFRARINVKGEKKQVNSLFKDYIFKATNDIRKKLGKKDFCLSVFKDNAGIIKFDSNYNLAFKVETHNSPSALDPYGGALTGVLGVNRDILGTGMGAMPIFNTDILCFGSPFMDSKKIPKSVLHPDNIMRGVMKGIEDAGNQVGIATVNGSIYFDESFVTRPLVYVGTGGLMPKTIKGKSTVEKKAKPGDFVVMIGNRIGKDGIHGATFSSTALDENSPVSAVQIGAPIIQKRFQDFMLEAEKRLLYNSVTDNGAGGLSSSVGEMAEETNGANLWLETPPLKYPGLLPWEILVSESQERMTLAVPKNKLKDFMKLSQEYGVESTVVGEFNNSGYFHCKYNDKTIVYFSMDFLHNGIPPFELEAEFKEKKLSEPKIKEKSNYNKELLSIMSNLNIASKENQVRRFDHEVQGMSVIKPFVGIKADGPSDAAVLNPAPGKVKGIAVSNGINPGYSEISCYHMAANTIDEAIRNAVCVGANPKKIAILDNFCWPDPKYHKKKNPEGKKNLANLLDASRACYDYAVDYMTPFISGKDSLSSDKVIDGKKYSIKPTLLISAIGIVEDVNKAITMDVKGPERLVYLLGNTKNELGGSVYYSTQNKTGANIPIVDSKSAKKRYENLHSAIKNELIESAHDLSQGGLAVALSEKAFSGDFGLIINLSKLNFEVNKNYQILFSESASRILVTVNKKHKTKFEKLFKNKDCNLIGKTTKQKKLIIKGINGKRIIDLNIEKLKKEWQKLFWDW